MKRLNKEKEEREIEELQAALRVKMAAKEQAEAEEAKGGVDDQLNGGDEEGQADDGEDEVICLDSDSDDDGDDRRRIPVSNDILYILRSLKHAVC